MMHAAWKTDRGRRKNVNEDAVLADGEAGIFLLADGMSSPHGGRVASRIAVHKAHAFLRKRLTETVGTDSIIPLLSEAFALAHSEVQRAAGLRAALRGMGTTLIALCIRGQKAALCHVGDSRAYLCRGEELRCITRDQTCDNDSRQLWMSRELFLFCNARLLRQAVGPSKNLKCDCHELDAAPGDILLLCSDGLTDMLSDAALGQLIALYRGNMEKLAEVLVEAANMMGGRDNISLILVAL